jgi:imidazole glycerol-phosphate synthase subunit HisH
VGWNNLSDLKTPLLEGLNDESFVYFVHSYYCELSDFTIAKTHYVLDFSGLMHKDNFYAMQAHPEKSGKVGERILENFLRI